MGTVGTQYQVGTAYYFKSHKGTGKFLNINTTGALSNNLNINIYNYSANDNTQKWRVQTFLGHARLASAANTNYCINDVNTNGSHNCTLYTYTINGQPNADTVVEPWTQERNTAEVHYKIQNINTNKFLTATGTASGSNVEWKDEITGGQDDISQRWVCMTDAQAAAPDGGESVAALAQRTTPISGTGTVTVKNIPDKVYGTEESVAFHRGAGLPDGFDFATHPDANTIVAAVRNFAQKTYNRTDAFAAKDLTYYLHGEGKLTTEPENNVYHPGVDINFGDGSNIYAMCNGTVTYSGGDFGTVQIRPNNSDVIYNYVHLRDIQVGRDTTVAAGTWIGKQGNTSPSGNMASHLHFEVRNASYAGGAPSAEFAYGSNMTTIPPYYYMNL